MRNLVVWSAVVAAVFGGVFGALLPLLPLSRMPQKDAEILRHTLMGTKRAGNEHAGWAVRTMYHCPPQLLGEARRDPTRALFTS